MIAFILPWYAFLCIRQIPIPLSNGMAKRSFSLRYCLVRVTFLEFFNFLHFFIYPVIRSFDIYICHNLITKVVFLAMFHKSVNVRSGQNISIKSNFHGHTTSNG